MAFWAHARQHRRDALKAEPAPILLLQMSREPHRTLLWPRRPPPCLSLKARERPSKSVLSWRTGSEERKMTVTDKQVAALHAQLAGRGEEHKRLFDELDADEVGHGYSALVAAAVFEAIERRFVKNGKVADDAEVIQFIAELRSKNADVAEKLDPVIAERLIFHSL